MAGHCHGVQQILRRVPGIPATYRLGMAQIARLLGAQGVTRRDGPLEDHPINPDWILEGAPHARISEWGESPDGTTSHWTWSCTAGRFRWYYDVDESIVVVAGSVSIQVDDEAPGPARGR